MKFCSFETTDDTLLSLSGLSTLAYGAQVRPSHFCLETRIPSSLKPNPRPPQPHIRPHEHRPPREKPLAAPLPPNPRAKNRANLNSTPHSPPLRFATLQMLGTPDLQQKLYFEDHVAHSKQWQQWYVVVTLFLGDDFDREVNGERSSPFTQSPPTGVHPATTHHVHPTPIQVRKRPGHERRAPGTSPPRPRPTLDALSRRPAHTTPSLSSLPSPLSSLLRSTCKT